MGLQHLLIFTLTFGILLAARCQGVRSSEGVEEEATQQVALGDLLKQAREIINNLEKDTAAPARRAKPLLREQNVHYQETPATSVQGAEEEVEVEANNEDAGFGQLYKLESQLYLDESARNVPAAMKGLDAMHEELLELLPKAPTKRALYVPSEEDARAEQLQTPKYLPGMPVLSGDNKGAYVSDISDGGAFYTEQSPRLAALAKGTFVLAVMRLTGLTGPPWPRDERKGVRMLHKAALAGCVEAQLALSNRYMVGRGVPKSCRESMRRGKLAAVTFIEETEASGHFQPPVEPLILRDRWRNADYLAPLPGLAHQAAHLQQGHAPDAALLDDPLDPLLQDMHREIAGGIGDVGTWHWLQGMPAAVDPEDDLQVLQRIAQLGDADAMFNLGYLHLKGIEVKKNITRARTLFMAAAEKGSAAAHNGLGVLYYNGADLPQDYAKARTSFEAGAELGDADSYFNLGAIWAFGHGVPRDLTKALEYFQKAHDAEHWEAPFQVAVAHEYGLGTAKNCTLASRFLATFLTERTPWHDEIFSAADALDAGDVWQGLVRLALAAEQGSIAAQADFGFTLQHTKQYYLPERFALAYDMYMRAGELGYYSSALTDAAHLAFDGHKYQLPSGTNRTRALELWRRAADQGDPEALFHLGRAYQTGAAVKRNTTRAAELFWEAVEAAPTERYAAAPLLAYMWLRVRILVGTVRRALAGSLRWAVKWDVAVLSALLSGLVTVFWRIWQRRRRHRQGGYPP